MGFSTTKLQARGVVVNDSNPLPVNIVSSPAGTATTYPSSVTWTRPSNTTEYTAGDVLGVTDGGNAGSAIHEFTSVGPAGATVKLTELKLQINVASVPSGMGNFRLHFYNASPTAILDNAAFDLVANDRAKYLGYVDLVTPADFGSTLITQNPIPRDATFQLASGQTSLWAQLETRATYTPTSAAVKTLAATFGPA